MFCEKITEFLCTNDSPHKDDIEDQSDYVAANIVLIEKTKEHIDRDFVEVEDDDVICVNATNANNIIVKNDENVSSGFLSII
jgi:hypothetical protein